MKLTIPLVWVQMGFSSSFVKALHVEYPLNELAAYVREGVPELEGEPRVVVGVDVLGVLVPYLIGKGATRWLEERIVGCVKGFLDEIRALVSALKRGPRGFRRVELIFVGDGRVPAIKGITSFESRWVPRSVGVSCVGAMYMGSSFHDMCSDYLHVLVVQEVRGVPAGEGGEWPHHE